MHSKLLRITLGSTLLIALLWALSLPAAATTVIPKSIQDCVHDADAIFVGHVIKVAPRWGTPAHQWIYTDITFQVEEVLQPNARVQPAGTVTVTYWGGVLDGKTIMASDMVLHRPGERWVMLLRPNRAFQTLTPSS